MNENINNQIDYKIINVNIDKNRIDFYTNVSHEAGRETVLALRQLNDIQMDNLNKFNNYQVKPIWLHINSYGGAAYDCDTIISTIKAIDTPVYTVVEGYAMSAGFMIFIQGSKRFLGYNSVLMHHSMRSGAYGQLPDLINSIDDVMISENIAMQDIVNQTNIPLKKLQKIQDKKQNWFLHATTDGKKIFNKYKIADDYFSQEIYDKYK